VKANIPSLRNLSNRPDDSTWPVVKLGDAITKSEDWLELDPVSTYKQLSVRLWGRGVVLRGEVLGSEIGNNRRVRVRAGQFILSRIDARNGALGIVPEDLDGAVVSNDFPAFDTNLERLLPEFLGWLSRTKAFVDSCRSASEGTTNRVRLKEDRFYGIEIPLPPLSEQQRIVEKIERLAAKIDEAQKLRTSNMEGASALFAVERARVMAQAFQAGSTVLSEAATLERGKFSHRPRNDPRFFGGNHPWIQIGEIEAADKYITRWSQTLNDEGLAISRKFPKGTLLISIAATIGSVGILDFDCCVPDSIVAITPNRDADIEFIYHYLGYLRTHLEDVAPHSAQKNINLRILTDLPLPRIAINQQRRIGEYLDGLQSKVEWLKKLQAQTSAELDVLLPSILDKAFRGEL